MKRMILHSDLALFMRPDAVIDALAQLECEGLIAYYDLEPSGVVVYYNPAIEALFLKYFEDKARGHV